LPISERFDLYVAKTALASIYKPPWPANLKNELKTPTRTDNYETITSTFFLHRMTPTRLRICVVEFLTNYLGTVG